MARLDLYAIIFFGTTSIVLAILMMVDMFILLG